MYVIVQPGALDSKSAERPANCTDCCPCECLNDKAFHHRQLYTAHHDMELGLIHVHIIPLILLCLQGRKNAQRTRSQMLKLTEESLISFNVPR